MNFRFFLNKVIRILKRLPIIFFSNLFQISRKLIFLLLSDRKLIAGRPICRQPLLCKGLGQIFFKGKVYIGVCSSPGYFGGYTYLEVRKEESKIIIDDGVCLNNNFCAISEGEGIIIGSGTLIGFDVCVFDSDFHELDPSKRLGGMPSTKAVFIGSNVFIGSRVIVLKGVTIGDNSVIAAGSVVCGDVPANVIAGGNPCRVLRPL